MTNPGVPRRPGAVVGVVDSECAFLHQAFRTTTGGTRLLAVWDQGGQAKEGPFWQDVPEFAYGRETLRGSIDELLAGTREEREAYNSVSYRVPQRGWAHGTHVLAVAGGEKDVLAKDAGGSCASSALLVAVQLPSGAIGRTHGVWINAHVIDAIHYILLRAPPDLAVVVNISLASNLGPHDGTSSLERAIDELVERQGGRLIVVVAAGNARQGRMHAQRRLEAGSHVTFSIEAKAGDVTPNFLDMWCSGSDLQRLSMTVKPPQGDPETILNGHMTVGCNAFGRVAALIAMSRSGRAPNGQGVQAFLGVAPTKTSDPYGSGEVGWWSATLKNSGKHPVMVQAWIARDDVLTGYSDLPATSQLRFEEGHDGVCEDATISSLAGGRETIVVGGYKRSKAGLPTAMYAGSGAGWTADHATFASIRGPDLCGPAAQADGDMPTVRFLSSDMAEPRCGDGTSTAAPYVCRLIANFFCECASERWFRKDELLERIRLRHPDRRPTGLEGATEWASSHWV